MLNGKTILVTGATGKQGGATARNLVKAGVHVKAFTRNPQSSSAKRLGSLGIELIKGNLNDAASVQKAMENMYGVFSLQNSWEFRVDEEKQNRILCDAAKAAGVKHIVFASIARCDDNPGLRHFTSKYHSEQYLISTGLPYTSLRAVYFMDNLKPNAQGEKIHWDVLPKYLGDKTTLQMISCEDIGWFAANSFMNPNEWIGKTMDIAGDNLTYPEVIGSFKKVFGQTPKGSSFQARLAMFFFPEIKNMFEWYREPRFHADIEKLRKIHPGLMKLEDYFTQIKMNNLS